MTNSEPEKLAGDPRDTTLVGCAHRAWVSLARQIAGRPRGRVVVGHLSSFGEACGRVAAEYKDVELEQRGEPKRLYDAVVYVRPLVRAEFDRFSARLREHTTGADDEPLGDAPIGLRRSTGAVLIGVEAATVDAAAVRVLKLVRTCLQEANVVVTADLQLEVREAETVRA